LKGTAPQGLRRRSVNAGALILVGVLGVFLVYQLTVVRGGSWADPQGWKMVQGAWNQVRALKLEHAREVFMIEENRPPQSDSELAQKGLWP